MRGINQRVSSTNRRIKTSIRLANIVTGINQRVSSTNRRIKTRIAGRSAEKNFLSESKFHEQKD